MGVYYFKIYIRREMNVKKAVSGGGPVHAWRVASIHLTINDVEYREGKEEQSVVSTLS